MHKHQRAREVWTVELYARSASSRGRYSNEREAARQFGLAREAVEDAAVRSAT
jgi:hypothetical protein